MSISELVYKIKKITEEKGNFLLTVLVMILVGVSSFGLGKLSVGEVKANDYSEIKNKTEESVTRDFISNENTEDQKKFVASKNGTKYYPLGCGGAKRIKPENEIWFKSQEDAEKSGYTLSATCK